MSGLSHFASSVYEASGLSGFADHVHEIFFRSATSIFPIRYFSTDTLRRYYFDDFYEQWVASAGNRQHQTDPDRLAEEFRAVTFAEEMRFLIIADECKNDADNRIRWRRNFFNIMIDESRLRGDYIDHRGYFMTKIRRINEVRRDRTVVRLGYIERAVYSYSWMSECHFCRDVVQYNGYLQQAIDMASTFRSIGAVIRSSAIRGLDLDQITIDEIRYAFEQIDDCCRLFAVPYVNCICCVLKNRTERIDNLVDSALAAVVRSIKFDEDWFFFFNCPDCDYLHSEVEKRATVKTWPLEKEWSIAFDEMIESMIATNTDQWSFKKMFIFMVAVERFWSRTKYPEYVDAFKLVKRIGKCGGVRASEDEIEAMVQQIEKLYATEPHLWMIVGRDPTTMVSWTAAAEGDPTCGNSRG